MQRLEVSGAVRPLYGSLDFKGLTSNSRKHFVLWVKSHPYKDYRLGCRDINIDVFKESMCIAHLQLTNLFDEGFLIFLVLFE